MMNKETAIVEINKILENFNRTEQFEIIDGMLDNYQDEIRANVDKTLSEMGISFEDLLNGVVSDEDVIEVKQ